MSELEFKRDFRRRFDGWSETYEQKAGGGFGAPDLQLLVGRQIVPVELKVCDQLWKLSLRPAQIQWHRRFAEYGGLALVALGCEGPKGWSMAILRGGEAASLLVAEKSLLDPRVDVGVFVVGANEDLTAAILGLVQGWSQEDG